MKNIIKNIKPIFFTSLLGMVGCKATSENTNANSEPIKTLDLTSMEQSVYSRDIAIITDHVEQSVSKKERQVFKEKLAGAIADMANKNISMSIFRTQPYEISDIMVFNQEKDKVLMLTSWLRTTKGKSQQVGFCDVFAGKKQADGSWYFHHSGLPGYTYGYNEKYRNGVFFTPKELIFRSLKKEVRDNQLVKYGNINPNYFDNHMWRW